MSFLVSDVFTRADLLLGSGAAIRWPDLTTKLLWYNDGVSIIRKERPDAKFSPDSGNLVTASNATATTDTSILDDQWISALAFYISAMCLLQDSEDKRDLERSNAFAGLFEKELAK